MFNIFAPFGFSLQKNCSIEWERMETFEVKHIFNYTVITVYNCPVPLFSINYTPVITLIRYLFEG